MGFLRKFLGFLLVSTVLTWSLAYVTTTRLLNFKYLETKANAGTFYSDMASVFPKLIAHDDANSSVADQAAISQIISADIVQAKIESLLSQMQVYYRDNGPIPTLDLRDVAISARAAGLEVSPDTNLDKPIEIKDPIGLKSQYQQAHTTVVYAPFVALALLVLIMITLPAPARYRSAAKTLLSAAISVGLVWGIFLVLPNILEGIIKSNKDIEPITPPLLTLVHDLGSDMATDFLKIAIGLVALAIAFFLFSMFGHKIGRSGKQEIKPKRPSPQSRPRLS